MLNSFQTKVYVTLTITSMSMSSLNVMRVTKYWLLNENIFKWSDKTVKQFKYKYSFDIEKINVKTLHTYSFEYNLP